jgi:hypothetical protein
MRKKAGTRHALTGALLGGAALALAACGAGSLVCREEAIRGTLRAPVVSGEDAGTDVLAGNVESRVGENPELDLLQAAIEGRAIGGRGLAMWLQRGLDHTLNLSLRFPTPLRTGDVLPVVHTHVPDRPFWGTWGNPPTGGSSVGVRLDGFEATSATGTARVVGLNPLVVELHIVASGPGRQLPIDGTLTVRHETSTESCFE